MVKNHGLGVASHRRVGARPVRGAAPAGGEDTNEEHHLAVIGVAKRLMYDSVEVAALPPGTMFAAYADGRWPNYWAVRSRFPSATVVSIATNPNVGLAHVLDVEPGDARASQFQAWAHRVASAGVRRPTAYLSREAVPGLLGMAPHGVIVDLWVADWTGHEHELAFRGANVVAVQWAAPGHGSPGHYDVSTVWDPTWHSARPEPF